MFSLKTELLPEISYFNEIIFTDDWIHFERTPDTPILYVIKSGAMYIEENGVQYTLQAGDMILLEAGLHHIGFDKSPCDYYYVHFSGINIQTVTDSNVSRKDYLYLPKHFSINDQQALLRIFTLLNEGIRIYEYDMEQYRLLISCKLIEILVEISNVFTRSVMGESIFGISTNVNKKMQLLLSYLHSSYNKKITGTSIEEALETNFDYLNRVFKKCMGTTIFQYLNTLRINRAKELLIATDMKSYEIASLVGFKDEYYFSKIFKKLTGVSPSAYSKL